jgi:hypothetical protein
MKSSRKTFFLGWVLSLNSVLIAADKDLLSDKRINKRIQQYRTAEGFAFAEKAGLDLKTTWEVTSAGAVY